MVGKTIGHYRVLEELGRGGMGVVYKAEDMKLDRVVALKFLPHHITSNEAEKARFIQEAKAAAALNHPHACAIYRIDEVEGEQFIEMEFVEGLTLRERIGQGPLDTKDAVRYGIQVGEALQEAHSRGIVHRDVKSDNIMVSLKNQVKVMDFGLAKLKGSFKLTKTASTVGTLAYMAPEQIQGGEVDARSDIFSFGVVLYEMIAGTLPFRGEHDASMMYSILNEEPGPLPSHKQEFDPELERIIRRALEKDPEDRYQHVDDMVSELVKLRKQTGRIVRSGTGPVTGSRHTRPTRGSSLKWAAFGGIAIFLIGVIWYVIGQAPARIDSIAVLPFVNATGDPETEYLAEGITETITNRLSQLSGLRVTPRSMVAKFGGHADPGEAGKELNVKVVLTGKVTQRGDRLSIQTELIDIEQLSQLWGEQYSRNMADLVTIQREIAQKVVEVLETRLSGVDEQRLARSSTTNADAYQAYIRGRFHWNKRTLEGNNTALTYLRRAVDLDPSFALAYVGVADCYFLASTFDSRTQESMPKARDVLNQALRLDPQLAEAYAGLGIISAYFDFDPAAGERNFRRSIELNPGYATGYHWLGEFLIGLGRTEEGFRMYERALELDPASLPIASDYGLGFHMAGQYERSIEELKKTIRMDPNFVRTHYYIVDPYLELGMEQEAFEALIAGMRAEGQSPERINEVQESYLQSGFRGVGKVLIERAMKEHPGIVTGELITQCLWAGETERAIAYIEQACGERNIVCWVVRYYPSWADLRMDPRIAELIKKTEGRE